MDGSFSVNRLWFPEGEEAGTVEAGTYFFSMADSQATFIEWSAGGSRNRRRRRVVPGDLWVYPPGQDWWVRRESGKTCIQLSLSVEWLRLLTAPSLFDLRHEVPLRDPLATQVLRILAGTAPASPDSPAASLYRESLVTTLVLHLLTHHGAAPRKEGDVAPLSSARLRAISDYVSERVSEKIALTDLARLAGLSATQFARRFRAATGQTPHQFVTALRVDRARELLVAGRHAPGDVAALTGFADQSHLTRHVRRLLGTTPGALRRRPEPENAAGMFQDRDFVQEPPPPGVVPWTA